MCGICGIYGVEDKALVEKMLSVLKHRGPDDKGIYTDANVSLGHARLSIIDLSEKGKQPMSNEDGNIWLSVNGEIYNFRELRHELEQKGHRFYSNSDSEVIIHTYEETGLDFVNRFRGMFALALYDKRRKRLVLARDHIGEKPLYYYTDGKKVIFASEIKAILEAGVKKEVDPEALCSYLAYQYVLGEKTLFKGIKKLLPSNMLILEPEGLRTQKYWEIKENAIQGDDGYSINRLRTLLKESVRLRLIADVPVGAFISGGIDSGASAALARREVKGQFHTFSVGFETFSELRYARTVSDHLGTTHHEIVVTADMVKQDLPKIAWHCDEPIGDAAAINFYYLTREAAKYVKVVLSGDGGDELFAGYGDYRRIPRLYNLLNSPIVRTPAQVALKLFPRKGNLHSFRMARPEKYLAFLAQPTYETACLYARREMIDSEIARLISYDPPAIDSFAIYPDGITHPLNQFQAIDCKNLLPEQFLVRSDKTTMANSVEARLPLLDTKIIDFAFALPPGLKIRHGQEKYILRKAVEDLLPKDIIARKKQVFGTPVHHWINTGLREMVQEKLNEGKLLRDLLKPVELKLLLKNLDMMMKHRHKVVWLLFALELWYDVYFLNQKY